MDDSSDFDFPLDFDEAGPIHDIDHVSVSSLSTSSSRSGRYADSLDELDEDHPESDADSELWGFVHEPQLSPSSDGESVVTGASLLTGSSPRINSSSPAAPNPGPDPAA